MTPTPLAAGRPIAPDLARPLRVKLSDLIPVFIFAICFTAWIPASVNVGGLNLRLSQALLPLVLGFIFFHQPVRRLSHPALIMTLSAALYYGSLLVWTLVAAPDAGALKAYGRIGLLGTNLLTTVAIYLLVTRTGRLQAALNAFVASVAVLNVVLVLAAGAIELGLPLPQGWLLAQDTPLLTSGGLGGGIIQRFSFSGVIAGCLSAAALVIIICLVLDRTWKQPKWFPWAIVAVSFGLVLGFSRQAVVSLAAGVALIGFYLALRGYLVRLLRVALVILFIGIVAVVGVSLTPGGQPYVQAFAGRTALLLQPDSYTTGTVAERANLWGGMWEDIVQNPLAGRGQDAYLVHETDPTQEGAHNFPLEVWHAAGISGLIGYLILHLFALWLAGRVLLARGVSRAMRWRVLALASATIAVILASVTNLIYWNPTYWMVLGLLLAGVKLAYTTRARHAAAR